MADLKEELRAALEELRAAQLKQENEKQRADAAEKEIEELKQTITKLTTKSNESETKADLEALMRLMNQSKCNQKSQKNK